MWWPFYTAKWISHAIWKNSKSARDSYTATRWAAVALDDTPFPAAVIGLSVLFHSQDADIEGYINDVLRGHSPAHQAAHKDWQKPVSEDFIQDILAIRSQVEAFLDECLEETLSYQPRIVAFTSVFQQHLAALSLAKRLKAKAPETFIILGEANCEGVMGVEVIRQFPFVDATISGEGDIVFPELVERVLEEKSIFDLQCMRRVISFLWIRGQSCLLSICVRLRVNLRKFSRGFRELFMLRAIAFTQRISYSC